MALPMAIQNAAAAMYGHPGMLMQGQPGQPGGVPAAALHAADAV